MSVPTTSRIDRLECDIDCRLSDLWAQADVVKEWNIELVAKFMRAAFGQGYMQALTEADRGLLCRTHGYRVPRRPRL